MYRVSDIDVHKLKKGLLLFHVILKKTFIFIFQKMIIIGALLDACGISYTEKQLKKLDRLFNHLVKGKLFKNYPGTNSKDNSCKDSSPNSKSLKVCFIENKEKESSEHVNQYLELENNIAIKEESVKEEVLEIKYEIDPLALFEAVENSKCNFENNSDDNYMLVYPEFEKEHRNVSHTYKNESRNNDTDIQKSEIENYSKDVAFKLEDMMSVHEEKNNTNQFLQKSIHLSATFVNMKLPKMIF